MKVIILHYGNYMARLSMRKFLDEYGNSLHANLSY
ncbi:helix-turn-helix domain-containing protein [Virgibacillus pantothenticus]